MPSTGSAFCVDAAIGHASTPPPINVTNSRRLIRFHQETLD
jgi:hypothetical protein